MYFLNVFIMISMVLIEKELSFEEKRPRRSLPGSAAESDVRPPNMVWFRVCLWPPKVELGRNQVRPPNLHVRPPNLHEFWRHVRPPKVFLASPINGRHDRNREFSPHFWPR